MLILKHLNKLSMKSLNMSNYITIPREYNPYLGYFPLTKWGFEFINFTYLFVWSVH
ncbi:MAG: hypothetical protein H6Q73_4228 [Firmicutes bacterium]|nr:hypothetical protein [Bacillota bacterium]